MLQTSRYNNTSMYQQSNIGRIQSPREAAEDGPFVIHLVLPSQLRWVKSYSQLHPRWPANYLSLGELTLPGAVTTRNTPLLTLLIPKSIQRLMSNADFKRYF